MILEMHLQQYSGVGVVYFYMYIHYDEVKKRQLRAYRLSPNSLSAGTQENMIERNLPEEYDMPPSCRSDLRRLVVCQISIPFSVGLVGFGWGRDGGDFCSRSW